MKKNTIAKILLTGLLISLIGIAIFYYNFYPSMTAYQNLVYRVMFSLIFGLLGILVPVSINIKSSPFYYVFAFIVLFFISYIFVGTPIASLTVVMVATSIVTAFLLFRSTSSQKTILTEENFQFDQVTKDCRLMDVILSLNENLELAKKYKKTKNLLIYGQYVLGAMLASNIVQEYLSKEMLGILGLLVIFSTVIQQRFKPDRKYKEKSQKINSLKKLKRETEDLLFQLKNNSNDEISLQQIRTTTTEKLNKIEEEEASAQQ